MYSLSLAFLRRSYWKQREDLPWTWNLYQKPTSDRLRKTECWNSCRSFTQYLPLLYVIPLASPTCTTLQIFHLIIIKITLFKLLKMYQFVKNKLVLIHEQINIIFLNYLKMIITGFSAVLLNAWKLLLGETKSIVLRTSNIDCCQFLTSASLLSGLFDTDSKG